MQVSIHKYLPVACDDVGFHVKVVMINTTIKYADFLMISENVIVKIKKGSLYDQQIFRNQSIVPIYSTVQVRCVKYLS